MNPLVHKRITGVSNETILANIKEIAAIRPTIIRIPVVPGLNDSESNILSTASFVSQLGKNLIRIELLPYHKFGTQTYRRIGRKYHLTNVEPPDQTSMEELKMMVESCGVKAKIGG
jgi:pyruvate formate lyase activating enzyme